MNAKSKALLSAVAMVLMLGCALVPLISTDSEIVAADDAQNDETEAFSITEILDSLLNMDGSRLSDTAGYFFIPVPSTEEEPRVLDEDITGLVEVSDAVTLKNGGEYKFDEGDQLIINEGGTLVLFPFKETDVSFSLIIDFYAGENLILMAPGSKISIFDMTFMLVGSGGDNFTLISMMTYDDEAECVFAFSCDESGKSEFRVSESRLNEMVIAESLYFEMLFDYRDIVLATGILMPISEGNGIVFSGIISLQELGGNNFWDNPPNIKFTVENFAFSYVFDSKDKSTLVKLSASVFTDESFAIFNNKIQTEGCALEVKDLSVKIVVNGDSVSIQIIPPCSAILILNNCSINSKAGALNFTLKASNLIIGLELDSPPGYDFDDSNRSLNGMEFNGNISLTFVDTKIAVSYKNYDAVIDFSANLNLDSIHLCFTDEGKWSSITIKQTEISGTLSSAEVGYTLPTEITKKIGIKRIRIASPELLYSIESTTEVTKIEITKDGDKTIVGFEKFESDFATVQGESDWKGKFEISALEVTEEETVPEGDGEKTITVNIGHIYLKNDIPTQQLFSNIIPVQSSPRIDLNLPSNILCIPTIDLELSELKYPSSDEEPLLTFKDASISVKDYRGLDEFFVKFDGKVKSDFIVNSEGSSSISAILSASGISGFVNNSGKEKDFTISKITNNFGEEEDFGTSVGFNLSIAQGTTIEDFLKIDASLEILKGSAVFKDGSLPFVVKVGSGVEFFAENLTAFGFVFEEGSDIDGAVSLDTDAELPLFFNKETRLIKIGDDYVLTPQDNGYVIELDLSKKTGGKLVANHGYKLPKSSQGIGFKMTSVDRKTGEFTVDSTGAAVSLDCESEKYRLTCEGTSESQLYEYGTLITLPLSGTVKKGMEFYGWSDGTAIYKPFDVFTMPSHDVVLKPVFVKNVTPLRIIEGSKIILVVEASEADLVKVSITDTEWDILRTTVSNTTFVIDEKTFEKQCCDRGTVIRKSIVLQSVATESSSGESKEMAHYDVRFYTVDRDTISGKDILDPFKYSDKTLVGTTVNVKVHGTVKDFKVFEVDYKGNLVAIDGATYTKCDDGTYNVSFNVSHAAHYAVEPVYEDEFPIGAVIGVVVILACAVGIGYYLIKRGGSS